MTARESRSAVRAMYVGVALTLVATIVPYIDRATADVLTDHIRTGYPTFTADRVDTAVTTYLVLLSAVGALGIFAWLWTIRAVKAGKRYARPVAITLLGVGTVVALAGLFVRDTNGEPGLPPLLGWVGLLPCLAGAVAVALLLRRAGGEAR